MSVVEGWRWFSIFGATPWRVSLEAPRLEVPEYLLPRDASSFVEARQEEALQRCLPPKPRTRPAGIFAAASAAGLLPVIPGRADTPDKVLEILALYPWIFGPFTPAYFQAQQKRAGLKKVDQVFLDYFRTLRQHDRAVFDDQVVGTIRWLNRKQTFTEHIEFLNLYDAGETDRALLHLATTNPLRVLVLETAAGELVRRYFGCSLQKDVELKSCVPPEDPAQKLTTTQLHKVRQRLNATGFRPSVIPNHAQLLSFHCALYFLSRAVHPEIFGFSAPSPSSRGLKLGFDSSVRPVMRPSGLPQYPWTYPGGGHGEWTVWYRLERELTPKLLQDQKLVADLLRTAVTDYPLEIVWIDPDEAAIADFLARLLAAKPNEEMFGNRSAFLGDRIRLVVKRSVPEINGWKVEEIREYAVRTGSSGRRVEPIG